MFTVPHPAIVIDINFIKQLLSCDSDLEISLCCNRSAAAMLTGKETESKE